MKHATENCKEQKVGIIWGFMKFSYVRTLDFTVKICKHATDSKEQKVGNIWGFMKLSYVLTLDFTVKFVILIIVIYLGNLGSMYALYLCYIYVQLLLLAFMPPEKCGDRLLPLNDIYVSIFV